MTKKLINGFSMPAIGKGTWMAGTKKNTYKNTDVENHVSGIRDVLTSGISYIDTAARYADGYGEELIGKAIKGIDRDTLFLTSKLSSKHKSYKSIVLAAKQSLNRMNAQYFDIYFVHYFDKRVSLEETMRAMDHLLAEGKIKHIGVCNFTVEQMKEAQSYTKNKIVANHIRYNLFDTKADQNGVIEYCQQNDMMVIAWRPFSKGLVTSDLLIPLETLAKKYDKTIAQIATAWLMQQKNIVVLSKLSTESEVRDTKDALNITLDKNDRELLRKGGIHDN